MWKKKCWSGTLCFSQRTEVMWGEHLIGREGWRWNFKTRASIVFRNHACRSALTP